MDERTKNGLLFFLGVAYAVIIFDLVLGFPIRVFSSHPSLEFFFCAPILTIVATITASVVRFDFSWISIMVFILGVLATTFIPFYLSLLAIP